jgi:protein involved in temperature-dependent protein secretion
VEKAMHDRHDEHANEKAHAHEHEAYGEAASDIGKLKKMAEYWINHNEEHARSYRLWAERARDAGYGRPGEILEEMASEIVESNERLRQVIQIIDSGGSSG